MKDHKIVRHGSIYDSRYDNVPAEFKEAARRTRWHEIANGTTIEIRL